ncbi:hypothetical protein PV779_50805 [Streptomyces sp. ID01-9D]|nr:hypothetical protein [Streptomyces sp. ID01-9D]
MIQGFPDSTKFDPSRVKEVSVSWNFHRDAMRGGENEGEDFKVSDGLVLVDFDTHETSNHNTKGDPAFDVLFENRGPVRVPKGVRVGIRLTPQDFPGGAGASFTGELKMKTVTEPDWYAKALDGIPD